MILGIENSFLLRAAFSFESKCVFYKNYGCGGQCFTVLGCQVRWFFIKYSVIFDVLFKCCVDDKNSRANFLCLLFSFFVLAPNFNITRMLDNVEKLKMKKECKRKDWCFNFHSLVIVVYEIFGQS